MIDEDGTKEEEKEENEGGDKEEGDLGSDEKEMETEQVSATTSFRSTPQATRTFIT